MIYHPLLFLFFFMSLGIRHQNLCERGLSEISTSLSLPFTLVFLLIFVLFFFFCYYHGEGQGRKAERKRFSGRSIFCA